MAIPSVELSLRINLDELELGDLPMFDIEQAASKPMAWMNAMRRFLQKYSNWSADDIDHIKFKELELVAPQIAEAVQRAATPFTKS